MSDPKTVATQIIDNVGKVIVGKQATLEFAIISLLCQGHLLIEDVPGVGQDDAGEVARQIDRVRVPAASSSRPICCPAM